ncbi:hypothetical protein SERLA73DRAFT_174491 [Serpula lacrymans var. lacrymans S7.3]|uniref:Enoyl reductase (ER) domain-containing protein n=2 Tax=Serpula lacrymans var. lacrymans TaxID=341189 RepID=F8PG32_SERL3|nr:uncharacterized protein SERLADRAFT_456034 [Serpula lacrymans var. lacrymans S7.9]EGO05367.1 hypothetical protein SERLA73DRAFT_174491 [Serpula lacrymans var. lacrymans S7.3]EGO31217.1 hypothetical protein SERLADRAFT_456034 [Serpula lacrymans var. lacrymans S7.9]
MATHTAIAATSKGVLEAIQVKTEKPGRGEVLVKVAYSSMIAFDTYITDLGYHVKEYPAVLGFNASGTVAEVGLGVDDLAVGDRVTAFAYQSSKARGMQQYAILSRTVCAKIPDDAEIALDAAVTIPDNFITAFFTLFDNLELPLPVSFPSDLAPPHADTPILVYGAGATSGQYAIQLLKLAGYKNIVATASARHHDNLRSLGATHVFDYSDPNLAAGILSAVGGSIQLAVDCVTAEGTLAIISQVLSPNGTIAILLPVKEGNAVRGAHDAQMYMEMPPHKNPFESTVRILGVQTFKYQKNEHLRDNLMQKILPSLLSMKAIKPNRVRLLDQGDLKERVEIGLDLLRNNKVSGEKVVVKIDDEA